jgi:hypothetical protein
MDDAVMHKHCMKLATRRCPILSDLRNKGNLILYAALYRDIRIYDVPKKERGKHDNDKFLGVDGLKVWRVLFPEERI